MMSPINIRYKISAGLVLSLATFALIVRMIILPELSMEFQIRSYIASLFVLSFIISIYFLINNSLNKVLPYENGLMARAIVQVVIGMVLLFGLHSILFGFLIEHFPIKVEKKFIVAIFIVDFFACLAINFAFFSEYFFQQWKNSIQKSERLEKEKAVVQYDNLKNQLNPHFLFNAFTSLNSLIYENPEHASQFLKHLSKVYRYLLENKEVVALRKEEEFLQNYLYLLETRFGKAIHLRINIQEADKEKNIVPVTLQNLLENALKHNVLTLERPLHIHIYTENGCVCVGNSLQRKSIVENSNRQGLVNLKNLYRYLHAKEIEFGERDGIFYVKVPLL